MADCLAGRGTEWVNALENRKEESNERCSNKRKEKDENKRAAWRGDSMAREAVSAVLSSCY